MRRSPRAWGISFATDPRLREPRIRCVPVMVMKRASQTLDTPVSVVNIASEAACRSTAAATASGRIKAPGLSGTVRANPSRMES